ncbi:integral membrane protein 2B-like [Amphiura filiformis]|uniref:integral membrane protein 2B-like n=1 Tax=Amphiura filiformis TaxID=82378 RepID=UPI003B216332
MTIYKTDKKAQQTKVVYSETGTATVPLESEEPHYCQKCEEGEDHQATIPPGPQCRTCSLAICCLLTLLMAFSLAGLLYFAAKPATYGECGVGLYPDLSVNSTVKEQISSDLGTGSETFEIPEFNGNHPATVLHDFTVEVTAYRDRIDHVCFLMKINTSVTVPPQNLLDFIIRYKRGDYTPRADVIHETMMVIQPPVDDFDGLGLLIEYLCHDIPTYWLVKVDSTRNHDLRRRSIGSSKHRTHHLNYFNGRYRLNWTIKW